MGNDELSVHYVCTHAQAEDLISRHERFWLSNCGCREEGRGCARSRVDVCLYFCEGFPPTGSQWREVSRLAAEELLGLAETCRLVTRPFRGEQDRSRVEGICFCCDDCCGYFLNPTERCDKGTLIEVTDRDGCDDCGLCVGVCYFGARAMDNGKLALARERCYGCGLCVQACQPGSVSMTARGSAPASVSGD
jgi:NAD-dependent dihydropyrimidine dehydrogenase PreA subunit